MKNTKPRLSFRRKECETLHDWYMFVGTDQRTAESGKFNSKIDAALKVMDDSEFNCFSIISNEAKIASKWYYTMPEIARGKDDKRIIRSIEKFITKQN